MDTLTTVAALADESRLRILSLLREAGDLCSCEIQAIVKLKQSNLSRHLTRLRQSGLIRGEKRGQWVHFQIISENWEGKEYISEIVDTAAAESAQMAEDLVRLKSYRKSGYSCKTIDRWRVQE